jgi:hypothetical protein
MKLLPILLLVAACATTTETPADAPRATEAAADSGAQDMAPAPALEQHAWLQQLVGEWRVTSEASMGPGAEPMKMESTEMVHSIGELWIVGEGQMPMDGGPLATLMTLGYDPHQKTFVGTWVDSMQTHMWIYRGELDPTKRVLTLSADGPSFNDPTKTAKYRDAFEIVGADHKVLTSSMQNDDGTWTTFLRADYWRKK